MSPCENSSTRRWSGFKHYGRFSFAEQMGRCGQSNGAHPDNSDGELLSLHNDCFLLCISIISQLRSFFASYLFILLSLCQSKRTSGCRLYEIDWDMQTCSDQELFYDDHIAP